VTPFPARPAFGPSIQPTSEILREFAATEALAVPVRDLVTVMGLRTHGILLVLFALPDAIPLPLPSVSAIIGIPLVLIAGHLMVFGEGSGLPERVLAARVPRKALRFAAHFGAPILSALEFFTRPRWHAVMARERVIGLVCLFLALLLLLPIPLVNFAPALCIVVVAMGMVQRDGILVMLGLALTAALAISLFIVADWLVATIRAVFQ
jgi:hypothetical protein